MSRYYVSQFKQTQQMFGNYLGESTQLTYDDWYNAPDDCKAPLLYTNFYDQITLAWYKVGGVHTYEEEAVSEALAMCNFLCGLQVKERGRVSEVKINRSTFTKSYIYNVMRNAFSSLNYERKATDSTYVHQDAAKRGYITVVGQQVLVDAEREVERSDISADYVNVYQEQSGDMISTITHNNLMDYILNLDASVTEVPVTDKCGNYVLDKHGNVKFKEVPNNEEDFKTKQVLDRIMGGVSAQPDTDGKSLTISEQKLWDKIRPTLAKLVTV